MTLEGLPESEQVALAQAHPLAWALYASRGAWQRARHLDFIGRLLVDVAEGRITRLAVSVPPRFGKSELISKYFPTWFLGRYPTSRAILCSYGQELTKQWSLAGRDMFVAHAPSVFGVTTWARSSFAEWRVMRGHRPTGGACYAVGRGGALTGRGADLLVCDDLVKDAMEANSASVRNQVWEWFQSVPLTRLEPGGRCVVVMTRWHHDDVIGRLERSENAADWTFVNLPAVAGEHDQLGREPGELLWPERWNQAWTESKRAEVGPYVWESLYQGRPTPIGGGLFKSSWFTYYNAADLPKDSLVRFGTVDLAASAKASADYTVVMSWGLDRATRKLYLLDVLRERLEGPDIVPRIKQVVDKWGLRAVFVERIGFQLTLIQAAARAGVPVREVRPDGDKVSRALPATAMLERGHMLFPSGAPWLATLESELLEFPHGAHDDQTDALSYAAALAPGVGAPDSSGGEGYSRRESHRSRTSGWRIGR